MIHLTLLAGPPRPTAFTAPGLDSPLPPRRLEPVVPDAWELYG
jgi:hypothetical protein